MKLAIIGSRSIVDDAWTLKAVDKAVKQLKPLAAPISMHVGFNCLKPWIKQLNN